MRHLRCAAVIGHLVWATALWGEVAAPTGPLPEGDRGIAAKYPGDVGIEKDPAVVFADGFEDGPTAPHLRTKWDVVAHDSSIRIATEAANLHGGTGALELTVPAGAELSVGVQKQLKHEQDVLFLRYYSKFEKGFDVTGSRSCHNGGTISAHYYVGGRATPGQRADGRNKFLAAFENECVYSTPGTPSPGHLNIYCYHPEQRDRYGDHIFPTGEVMPNTSKRGDFGPDFVPRPHVLVQLDRWYCFEYMVKANTVGQRDGRIACWLDGKLIADFRNLRLRDVESLKIDHFGVGLYIAQGTMRANKKWFDDVVAATSYIGPMVEKLPNRGRTRHEP